MGAIGALVITWLVCRGIYSLTKYPDSRLKFLTDLKKSPITLLATYVLCALFLIFFWGVMIPSFGELKVGKILLWQFAGLGCLVGMVIACVWSSCVKKKLI